MYVDFEICDVQPVCVSTYDIHVSTHNNKPLSINVSLVIGYGYPQILSIPFNVSDILKSTDTSTGTTQRQRNLKKKKKKNRTRVRHNTFIK